MLEIGAADFLYQCTSISIQFSFYFSSFCTHDENRKSHPRSNSSNGGVYLTARSSQLIDHQ
jgi:hypothetical protein